MKATRSVMRWVSGLAAGIAIFGQAQAVTVTFREGVGGYTGTQDTYISNVGTDQNVAYGTEVWTRLMGDAGEADVNRKTPLLRFDNIIGPGAGQIPAGSSITSATLTLRPGDTFTGATDVFRLLATWSETSSWSSSFGGNGVDYSGATEAASTPDASVASFSSAASFNLNVTAGVQAWALGASNYGWAFINQVYLGSNWTLFATSENATVTSRPLLTVDYVVPEPTAGLLLTLAMAGLSRRRRCRPD